MAAHYSEKANNLISIDAGKGLILALCLALFLLAFLKKGEKEADLSLSPSLSFDKPLVHSSYDWQKPSRFK